MARSKASKKKSARSPAKKKPTRPAARKSGRKSGAKSKTAAKTPAKAAARKRNAAPPARSTKPRPEPSRPAEWVTVPDPADPGDSLRVSVPAGSARSKAARDEAAYNAQVLHDNQQISRSGALKPGETHVIEETPDGERQLVRKRVSAI